MKKYPPLGILAMQGDIQEHQKILWDLGIETIWVKKPEDLKKVEGLFLPGGESSTMLRLLSFTGLDIAINERCQKKDFPMFATCAGTILLARDVIPDQRSLSLLDIKIQRNAYGRQVESFEVPLQIDGLDELFTGIFIRAPKIIELYGEIEILSTYRESPVFIRQDKIWGLTFHPEISQDTRIHKKFLEYWD
ncbi:MAG: pyridoxal 5'-phosphate synthase glutaminase subunit PdxT [Candidatus Coatesbacteria bacterium]|nr:pyridoxal 5'-phosphate synthase glutaminase subunit PdxT [Candidatus Coatesbacteria bacterium]